METTDNACPPKPVETPARSLILGGVRSGKSAHAEALARQAGSAGREVVVIATAHAGDEEMARRIAMHRERRDARWITIEEPLRLGAALRQWCGPQRVVVVDCLNVWLSNLLFAEGGEYPEVGRVAAPDCFAAERADLLAALQAPAGDVILVANEVGLGVVPMGAVSRFFVDEAGRLNQALAALCENVDLIVAGLPLRLKATSC
ncbi:adenosylcobinamide kinase /adenosylcobinamide-phosphate guanylyltransferase [Noviherbaspirillum humi]|uniref:Bifunctional adenosylcobalamin biosynthesis protein n=1 Tax=Noviherbaspirillum humi TaxID=1688639 RepID=A0A239GRB5_9BURK|nr:bifunctional adenosylcobinamide kinase/adenosylcobinamide-phosphate guanylyltransferase [Noviherbaspirillum humi]SNS71328.1 adenosylcobinamide kinase /adenosylcobinamide-phosphate guanylyltransferase [Noviherbaspirillum humi]